MPQVDIVTFASQNFWLVLNFIFFTAFITLYFLIFCGVYYNIYYKYNKYCNIKANRLVLLIKEWQTIYDKLPLIIKNFYQTYLRYILNQYFKKFLKKKGLIFCSLIGWEILHFFIYEKYKKLI